MHESFLIIGTSFLLSLAGCKDSNPFIEGQSPSTVVFPANNVSYNAQVQVLFNQSCALSGCHDDGPHESALTLTSWGSTVVNAPPSTVVPGHPDASVLVLRIEGALGARMPPTVNPLNQNQINGIRTWIAEGAKQN